MFGDFIDNSLPILIVSIILGLILSGIGAMYVSKKFIYFTIIYNFKFIFNE